MLALPLLASIEDQRARLPPPAEQDAGADCSDPVAGIWLGRQYNPRSITWQRYRLNIERVRPGASDLRGDISVHFWVGTRADEQPPTDCTGRGLYAEIQQHARGTFDGTRLQFGGYDWSTAQVFCGSRNAVAYNPDHFQGVVNAAIEEFQSVNNDGGTAVDEPVVFRRVECPRAGAAVAQPPRNTVVVLPPTNSQGAIELRPRSRWFSCARSR